ncbi:MAG TPA: thiamine-phosphate kinase [Casimicrobiaceae bacterium]
MNEFALIDRYFRRGARHSSVRIGVGDDAAVIRPTPGMELVLSVDMLVEDRHFLRGTDPYRLGHKTLAANLSDLAAMGATPRYALLAGALPDADETWLASFSQGFFALAEAYAVDVIGGDTTKGPRNLCVTIIGEAPPDAALRRGGAKPDDDVYVSGELGDAALALAVLQKRTTLSGDELSRAQARLEVPEPRVKLGERLRGIASAALDISDGLSGDLVHILDASHVGAAIELARIPRSRALDAKLAGAECDLALACLLAGGDDYELCFTAPPAMHDRIASLSRDLDLPLSRIGTITGGPGLKILDDRGNALPDIPRAFDHFA